MDLVSATVWELERPALQVVFFLPWAFCPFRSASPSLLLSALSLILPLSTWLPHEAGHRCESCAALSTSCHGNTYWMTCKHQALRDFFFRQNLTVHQKMSLNATQASQGCIADTRLSLQLDWDPNHLMKHKNPLHGLCIHPKCRMIHTIPKRHLCFRMSIHEVCGHTRRKQSHSRSYVSVGLHSDESRAHCTPFGSICRNHCFEKDWKWNIITNWNISNWLLRHRPLCTRVLCLKKQSERTNDFYLAEKSAFLRRLSPDEQLKDSKQHLSRGQECKQSEITVLPEVKQFS